MGLLVSSQGLLGLSGLSGVFGLLTWSGPEGQRARTGLGCCGDEGIFIYCTNPATKHEITEIVI